MIGKTTLKQRLAILFFGVLFIIGNTQVTKQKSRVILSDAEGYFIYLPAWFVHGNFSDIKIYTTRQFKRDKQTNNYYTKYTYGVALLEAPFFAYQHIKEAVFKGRDVNKLEWSYNRAIRTSGWFYLCLGGLFLFLWLSQSFKWYIALGSVVLISLGTNLYFYAVKQPGASHVYSFALFSAAIYLVDKFYRSGKIGWLNATFLGLILGIIILIRPTNIFLVAFLALYTVSENLNLKDRLSFLLKNSIKLVPFVIISIFLWVFQFKQWSIMSGDTTLYSYGNEEFTYLFKPKILRVLFDVQNGLFVFSPMMLIAVYGILRNIKTHSWNSRLMLCLLLVITWTFASWWSWWFGGAYGHRCYVEYYSIFVLALAWIVDSIYRTKDYVLIALFTVLVALMVHYSIGLSDLYQHPWEGPNWNWDTYSEKVRSLF